LLAAAQFQPTTIGQASRMGGVSPADVTSLILHLELDKRQRAAASRASVARRAEAEAEQRAAAEAPAQA